MTTREVRARLNEVARKHGIAQPLTISVDSHALLLASCWWQATVLRALANALDGQDDASLAMFKDLKEDSAAYQRGYEDGKRSCRAGDDGTGCQDGRRKLDPEGPFP